MGREISTDVSLGSRRARRTARYRRALNHMAPKQATSCGIRDRLSKELLRANQEAAECGNKESKALMLGNRNALEEAKAQFLNAARVRSAALMALRDHLAAHKCR
jgi:hypothetical protein